MIRVILTTVFSFLLISRVMAAIRTETIEYTQDKTVMSGYLAYEDTVSARRPGILLIHEWWGLNDYIKMRARMLASLGYVVFAADIYGKNVSTTDPNEAGALAGKYKGNRALFRARLQAALKVLSSRSQTDTAHLGAVGYCFGGTGALELARSGSNVNAVVSFHGGLSSPAPQDARNIKGQVLVLSGADDPYVPPEEHLAFEKEMKDAGVRYQVINYPGAVHGFTNPANKGDLKGALYNDAADRASWQAMKTFLERAL